jgi:hypothetical protein
MMDLNPLIEVVVVGPGEERKVVSVQELLPYAYIYPKLDRVG